MVVIKDREMRIYLFWMFGISWTAAALSFSTNLLMPLTMALFYTIAPVTAVLLIAISFYGGVAILKLPLFAAPSWWWVLALALPLAFYLILSLSAPFPTALLPFSPQYWLLLFFICLVQEVGWRGFLQREIIHVGFWKSSFLIGIMTGIWSIPLLVIWFEPHDSMLLLAVVFILLSAPLLAFVATESKSVVTSAFLHMGLLVTIGQSWLTGTSLALCLLLLTLANVSTALYLKRRS
ncbi:CPBP family glutamic-type intramembrane protease [Shouchella shacheensis]|uniref:CPBP family glutamic-type intramembrane protease n=1 Tax=Shouchella shacheensis TaxID=1649580 RepID=UPI00073FBC73|nr:CPBP family glutamic-type intramembrane protease [Shouchella shacheensis]